MINGIFWNLMVISWLLFGDELGLDPGAYNQLYSSWVWFDSGVFSRHSQRWTRFTLGIVGWIPVSIGPFLWQNLMESYGKKPMKTIGRSAEIDGRRRFDPAKRRMSWKKNTAKARDARHLRRWCGDICDTAGQSGEALLHWWLDFSGVRGHDVMTFGSMT